MSIELPHMASLPRMPGGQKPFEIAPFPVLSTDAHEPDQFGLDPQVFKTPSGLARYYIKLGLDFLKLPLNVSPSLSIFGGGTIPEIITFGGLLDRGYIYNQQVAPGFTFQSSRQGGRAAGGGGAVLDFILWKGDRVIGVNVDSIFHALGGSFAGGAKVEKDINQEVKLLSKGSVTSFFRINLVARGMQLEYGTDAGVREEFRRMENA